MTEDSTRRTISWATLAAAGVATFVMAIWGFNALTAPVEKDDTSSAGSPTDTTSCTPGKGDFVQRSDVTVSVYNAGKKSGRAQATLDLLENDGFVAGAVGNAPTGTKVARAEVHTTRQNDPKAELVALALGKNTPVVVTTVQGPGLDVMIGDKFKKLDSTAPRKVRATAATTC